MTRRAVPDPKTYAALTRDALAADTRAALAAVDARWVSRQISMSEWVRFRGEVERRATTTNAETQGAPESSATPLSAPRSVVDE